MTSQTKLWIGAERRGTAVSKDGLCSAYPDAPVIDEPSSGILLGALRDVDSGLAWLVPVIVQSQAQAQAAYGRLPEMTGRIEFGPRDIPA